MHGTTVTTNAVLTRRGARTGLLATKGFRDALALRIGLREEPYDNRLQPPVPLVPRYLRLGIEGRVDWAGDEVTPLSLEDVRAACEVFRGEGVEAVAISFMHSPTRRRARARGARPLPRAAARGLRDRVERPAAAGALLRPHLHDGAERLRRADHHALPRARSRRASPTSASAACC